MNEKLFLNQDSKKNKEEFMGSKEELPSFDNEIRRGESAEDFLKRLNDFVESDKSRVKDQKNKNDGEVRIKRKLRFDLQDEKRMEETYREYKDYHKKAFDLLLAKDLPESLDQERNYKVLNKMFSRIGTGARDYEDKKDDFSSLSYFSKTNQSRSFFPRTFKKDQIPYALSLFEVSVKSPESIEYLKRRLDDKKICLLGGGDSVNDLLQNEIVKPREVVNIDPYLINENSSKNSNKNYRSFPFKADDQELASKLKESGVKKFDEIWASYSVPFYNQNREEIYSLFDNILDLLEEGGNFRMTPLNTQNEECKRALIEKMVELESSNLFNFHLTSNSLIIHRIKQEK